MSFGRGTHWEAQPPPPRPSEPATRNPPVFFSRAEQGRCCNAHAPARASRAPRPTAVGAPSCSGSTQRYKKPHKQTLQQQRPVPRAAPPHAAPCPLPRRVRLRCAVSCVRTIFSSQVVSTFSPSSLFSHICNVLELMIPPSTIASPTTPTTATTRIIATPSQSCGRPQRAATTPLSQPSHYPRLQARGDIARLDPVLDENTVTGCATLTFPRSSLRALTARNQQDCPSQGSHRIGPVISGLGAGDSRGGGVPCSWR